jgi:hypothetical protein
MMACDRHRHRHYGLWIMELWIMVGAILKKNDGVRKEKSSMIDDQRIIT